MTLDDFRRLNFREVGTWPLLPKIIDARARSCCSSSRLGAFFDWKDQCEALDARRSRKR